MAVKKTTEQENTGSVKDLTRLMKQGGSQEDVQKKMKELASTSSKPSTAQPSAVDYSKAYENYRDQYLNRGDFSFDVNTDALYKQYKDQYTNAGKRAMQDTIGQAAAMTGGYGNSYAQTAGQQAYNQYMTDLTAQIPELYQLAREMYDREGEDLMNKYSMLYGEARDQKADEQWQQTFDYQKGRDAVSDARYDREWAYQKERDAVSDARYDEEWAYQKERDAVSDARYDEEFAEGVRQFNASLAQDESQFKRSLEASSSSNGVTSDDPLDYKSLGFGTYDGAVEYIDNYAYENGKDAALFKILDLYDLGYMTSDVAENLMQRIEESYSETEEDEEEKSIWKPVSAASDWFN